MKMFSQTLAVLFGIALLGALGVGGYSAVKYIVSLFGGMDFRVAGDTSTALVVALVAALIIGSSVRQAGRQSKVNQLHSEKAATYRLFVDVCADLYQSRRGPGERCAADLSEPVQTLDRLLALYGSPAVIKAHTALRALERAHGTPDPRVRSQLGKALIEMRKDLGSKTLGLRPDELLQLVLPDSDTIGSGGETTDPSWGAAVGYQPK